MRSSHPHPTFLLPCHPPALTCVSPQPFFYLPLSPLFTPPRFPPQEFLSEEFQSATDEVCRRLSVTADDALTSHNLSNEVLRQGCARLGYPCGITPRNCSSAHACERHLSRGALQLQHSTRM